MADEDWKEDEGVLKNAQAWAKRVKSFSNMSTTEPDVSEDLSSGQFSAPPPTTDEATKDLQSRVATLEHDLKKTNAFVSQLRQENNQIKALLEEAGGHMEKLFELVDKYKTKAQDGVRAKQDVQEQLNLLKEVRKKLVCKNSVKELNQVLHEIFETLDRNPGDIIKSTKEMLAEIQQFVGQQVDFQNKLENKIPEIKSVGMCNGEEDPKEYFSRELLKIKKMYAELNSKYVELLESESKRQSNEQKKRKIKEIEEKMFKFNNFVEAYSKTSKQCEATAAASSTENFEEVRNLKSKNCRPREDLQKIKKEKESLAEQVEGLQKTDSKAIREKEDATQNEMARLKAENSVLKENNQYLLNQNGFLQRNFENLVNFINKQEASETAGKMKNLQDSLQSKENEVTALETENADLKKQVAQQSLELVELRNAGRLLADRNKLLEETKPPTYDMVHLLYADLNKLIIAESGAANSVIE